MSGPAVLLAAALGCVALDRASKRVALDRRRVRFSAGPTVLARSPSARHAWPILLALLLASVTALAVLPGSSAIAAAALTGLAFGGAASNLFEARRHRRGVDFIPVLPSVAVNLADLAIGVGLTGRLLLLST